MNTEHSYTKAVMLDRERERILKKKWANVQEFAEELYTLLGDDTNPVQMGSGIEVTPDSRPPILLNGVGDDFPFLQARRRDGSTITLSVVGGNLTITGSDGRQQAATGARAASAVTFPIKLTSYLGNNLYGVTLYRNGVSVPGEQADVLQIGGDPNFPHITDGSVWAMATRIGQTYYMMVPVWE